MTNSEWTLFIIIESVLILMIIFGKEKPKL